MATTRARVAPTLPTDTTAQRRALLARRLAMLTGAERLFRNWTVLHKPLTYLLGGAVLLHVIAHYIYAAQYGA